MDSKKKLPGLIGAIVLISLLFGGWFLSTYNNLVIAQEGVDARWAQVESQYQKRADLIPNLVETVKGFASQEENIFLVATKYRSQWGTAISQEWKIEAAKGMDSAISKLLLVSENYPELKSNESFLELQSQLQDTENRIALERVHYNDNITDYNTRLKKMPGSIISGMYGLEPKGYFKAENDAEVTTVSTTTPSATAAVTPEITYPSQEEVTKYLADLKNAPQDEVKMIDFQNINVGANELPNRAYHRGGYVAVSVIISNYTSLVMAYKNHNDIISIGNYTASTIEEKRLYNLLRNITYYRNGYYIGNLIPTNITIINPSYTINKNGVYQVNYTYDLPPMTNPYASFEFVVYFIGNHGFWVQSYGWIDAKKKQIWIRQGY